MEVAVFELELENASTPMIDFGSNGKVLFQLPVLGAKGVPMGITSSFSIFWEKFQSGRKLTEHEVASAWNFFITTLADTYPDATRQLARLDEANLQHVIKHWVSTSAEQGFDAGKA
jgi:hypothetical protein